MSTHQNDQFKTNWFYSRQFENVLKRLKNRLTFSQSRLFSVQTFKIYCIPAVMKIHCNFLFRFQWTHRGSDKSTPLSYDSAGGHHEVVFSLYFSSGCYLPRSNGKQYNDAFFSLLTILILEHIICGKRDPVTQFLFFQEEMGRRLLSPQGPQIQVLGE